MNTLSKHKFCCLLFIQLLLIILPLIGIFSKDKTDFSIGGNEFYYIMQNEKVYSNSINETLVSEKGVKDLYSNPFDLEKGIYKIELVYSKNVDGGQFELISLDNPKYLQTDLVDLPYYYQPVDNRFHFWVNHKSSIQCHFNYGDNIGGEIAIDSVHITFSMQTYFRTSFEIFLAFLLFDLFLLYVLYWKKHSWEQRIVPIAIIFIALLSSIPLFKTGIPGLVHSDIDFHLYRIEALADGLRSGIFPVKIQPDWCNGYGYAVGVFYPSFFLYIPAILRLLGFPIGFSYKLYIFLFHILTAYVSYYCFSRIAKNRIIGIIVAASYSLSTYRMVDLLYRCAIGEFQAITFLPLIIYGIYLIFTQDTKEKNYRRNYLFVAAGFTGLLQSHILSCEMVGFFTIAICLLCVKRVFVRERFLELVKSVITILFINIGFIVPFLDFFLNDKFWVNDGSRDNNTIQQFGAPFSRLFQFFFHNMNSYGPQDMPIYLGVLFSIVVLVAFLFLIIYNTKKKFIIAGMPQIYFLTVLSLWMCLDCFPYDIFKGSTLLNTLIVSLQFPWRFFSLSMALISFILCGILAECTKLRPNYRTLIFISVFFLGVVSGVQFQINAEDKIYGRSFYNDRIGMNSFSQSAGEYILSGTDIAYLNRRYVYNLDGHVKILSYELNTTDILITCKNDSDTEGLITVPRLAYRGYVAKDVISRQKFALTKDDNNSLQVVIPTNFDGTIKIYFQEFWYWRLAELISLLSVIGLCVYELKKNRNGKLYY